MNLVIDIGNSRIKIAVFDQQNKIVFFQIAKKDNWLEVLTEITHHFSIEYVGVSQVGKPIETLNDFLQKKKLPYMYVSSGLKLPFGIAYETPQTLGADRIALASGALAHQQNTNQLIIDVGTCVTYDFITDDNVYQGGAISPGLKLRYKSLNDYTEKLPMLNTAVEMIPLIGKNTNMSIHSGILHGLANEIEGIIVKYKLKFDNLTVYLTGGDQKLLERYIKNKIFVNSNFLLLEGINYLLNLNK